MSSSGAWCRVKAQGAAALSGWPDQARRQRVTQAPASSCSVFPQAWFLFLFLFFSPLLFFFLCEILVPQFWTFMCHWFQNILKKTYRGEGRKKKPRSPTLFWLLSCSRDSLAWLQVLFKKLPFKLGPRHDFVFDHLFDYLGL